LPGTLEGGTRREKDRRVERRKCKDDDERKSEEDMRGRGVERGGRLEEGTKRIQVL